jgi:hypothetical protein
MTASDVDHKIVLNQGGSKTEHKGKPWHAPKKERTWSFAQQVVL